MQLDLRWALFWFGRPRNRPITYDDLVDAETRVLNAEERIAELEQPALPEDCDDLCTCGHERFHHDDGREMGVYTNCKARGCGCERFDAALSEGVDPEMKALRAIQRALRDLSIEQRDRVLTLAVGSLVEDPRRRALKGGGAGD